MGEAGLVLLVAVPGQVHQDLSAFILQEQCPDLWPLSSFSGDQEESQGFMTLAAQLKSSGEAERFNQNPEGLGLSLTRLLQCLRRWLSG